MNSKRGQASPVEKRRRGAEGNAAEPPHPMKAAKNPGAASAPKPPLRATPLSHYRRARQDRGEETRARLIEAALDVFGRLGFEGATTRQIAKEAGANLAAIVYHFGSKEALQRAVAEHIVASVRERVGPALSAAGAPGAAPTPRAARAALARLIGTFVEVILGSAEAERWARFIVREQLQPTSAFEIIYGFMGPAHGIATRLVATALGRQQEAEEVRLRVFTLLGQVLIFRIAQTLVLRRLGWRAIGPAERAKIKTMVLAQIEAILDRESAS